MGGIGSGNRWREKSLKCHQLLSIDLAWLRRRNIPKPGRWADLQWFLHGQEIGKIKIASMPAGLLLSYRHRIRGEEKWIGVDEVIPLVDTGTAFGGRRQWFQCLTCRRPCRIIYGGAYFRCRRCMRLRYQTQDGNEPAFVRAADRALKIRYRLGCQGGIDDPFPLKPKGMHWTTYQRLMKREARLHEIWTIGIEAAW